VHRPMLFGMPFLLSWNLIWMVLAAAILAMMLHFDSRDDARESRHSGATR
jgi:uncharacterized membrane protein